MTDASTSTPCVKICVVDPVGGLCIGCGRTPAEIAIWPELGDGQRREIMAELSQRLAGARTRSSRAGRISARRPRAAWP